MIQEARHRVSVDVADLQGCDPSTALLGNKLEQQRQRISVGTDGVDAGAALLRQAREPPRIPYPRMACSSEYPPGSGDAFEQRRDIAFIRVEPETGPRRSRHAQMIHQRLRTMMSGSNRNAKFI